MNKTASDLQLLEDYQRLNSEESFAALVSRYVDLVYSAGLRQTRSPQLAEEVSQSVFTDLWKNARKLKPDTTLTAWLYSVTRRTAIDVVRRESRRQLREQIALEMTDMNANAPSWPQIEPLLEEAMDALDETDRAAILLRYFDNKSLREVGQSLGTSEDAAQKRVSRAVGQLRAFYSRHGVAASAAGLAAVLSANAVQSAPLGLSSSISVAASLSGAALHHSATMAAAKTLIMTTTQKALISASLAVAVGTALYATHEVSNAHGRVDSLEKQQASLNEQMQQLAQERDEATANLAAALQTNSSTRQDAPELAKLRGEVARLRSKNREISRLKAEAPASDPETEAALKTWAVRATQLKEFLARMPDKAIPELQLVTEKDWFDAVKSAKKLETDADLRQALSDLRHNAKNEFAELIHKALPAYLKATEGMLPTDVAQLKPYFPAPVSDDILQRYSMLQTGRLSELPDRARLIGETAPPVDDEYDTVFRFSINGTDSSSVNRVEDLVKQAGVQFAEAHKGLLPTDPSQLTPYLTQQVDPSKVQRLLSEIPPGITTLEQLKTAGILRR
jgi:RNA polymerase sigma factor (sigma-70 family)